MDKTQSEAHIDPVMLGPDSRFKFRCHKQIKCFTLCCRDINIILTPYDIIRLKNRLKLTSEQFLALYTEPQILEKTDLPVVTLKFLPDQESAQGSRLCPFVRPGKGCLVYTDRPTTCRYYPLGVASLSHKQEAEGEAVYFMVREPHCLGFEEDTLWTVEQWREDQGVDLRDRINAEWTDLLVRKRSFPRSIQLTDQSKKMFFMISYNINKFRQFVFESSFLKRYEVAPETLEEIKNDEVALLQFGLRWLKGVLFKREAGEEGTEP